MPKKAYVGINNVARKIKKGYIGVNGVARKIKKAYVGVGGVARPFWSGEELTYYGQITSLSFPRERMEATHVGNYALFFGGYSGYNSSSPTPIVDAYDTSLTRTSPTRLSATEYQYSATHVGNYALIHMHSGFNVYDTSLTMVSPTDLSINGYNTAATHIGNYALFGGGTTSTTQTSSVHVFSASLTKIGVYGNLLSVARQNLSATHVGDYALFGGGIQGSGKVGVVDAIDMSLTRITATSLSVTRSNLSATHVGDYALFGGGHDGGLSTVDAYSSSLTRSIPTELSVARYSPAATHVGNYALFGGGDFIYYTGNLRPDYLSTYLSVDVYDTSLVRTTISTTTYNKYHLSATNVGNYALFGGGIANSFEDYSTVCAFVASS